MSVIREATGTFSESVRLYLVIHTEKTWNPGTTKNSHIGHWTCTSESTNVNVQNSFTRTITSHVAQIVNTRTE
jgi:hypothetical protein